MGGKMKNIIELHENIKGEIAYLKREIEMKHTSLNVLSQLEVKLGL